MGDDADHLSDSFAERRGLLHARARALAAIRAWFAEAGFIEADVGALVACPGAEVHLEAFAAGGAYLHTSPELALKQLIAAGERQLYFLGKVYRAGERSGRHLPEFTMAEWYRAHAPYEAVMADSVALCQAAAGPGGLLRFKDKTCDPFAPPERLSVQDAFLKHAGIDLLATVAPDGAGNRDALAAAAGGAKPDDDWSDIFSAILATRVEPHLGQGRLCLLTDYPYPEAALARRSLADPRTAERFELYACGVELANGFGELTDEAEQRARFSAAMAEKQKRYGVSWPADEGFFAALPKMPDCSGVALGVDRLIMLALGAPRITDVVWRPVPE